MANTLLNTSMILNAALPILHQKLNFIGSITRTYDAQFGRDNMKIGSTINIRNPNQFTVTTGSALSLQDVTETTVPLVINTQKHVDIAFSSSDLALNIFDFSEQFIEPAMAVLAASIESDALNAMATDVYNQVNGHGSPQTFRNVLTARKLLRDNLAPPDIYMARLNTQDNLDIVDSVKGLFQDSQEIKSQYRDGVVGRTGGFEIAENTFLSTYTRGAATAAYTVNGAGQTGSSLVVQTGTGAGTKGDVFTIAGVFRVHPETKVSTGILQQFVLTAAYAGGGGTMSISPAITTSGAYQSVSASPANAAAITWAGTISTAAGLSLAYHKSAFAFATVDLPLPNGADMAGRKVQDGISLRMWRQGDIQNDRFPCRLDVLYGYKTLRPQVAVRLAAN